MESEHPYDALSKQNKQLIELFCRPLPPLTAGPAAAEAGARAMLDVSDGLVRDAGLMAEASGVVVVLDPDVIETMAAKLKPAADLLGAQASDWVLGGGEDHGLLAAFPPGVSLPAGFTAIGSIRAGDHGVQLGSKPLETMGWDHFAH